MSLSTFSTEDVSRTVKLYINHNLPHTHSAVSDTTGPTTAQCSTLALAQVRGLKYM